MEAHLDTASQTVVTADSQLLLAKDFRFYSDELQLIEERTWARKGINPFGLVLPLCFLIGVGFILLLAHWFRSPNEQRTAAETDFSTTEPRLGDGSRM